MKTAVILLSSLAVLTLATGCVNEVLTGVPGAPVTFSASSYYENAPETKTAYSSTVWGVIGNQYERIDWVDGDKIRIYSPEAAHRNENSRHWADYDIIPTSIRADQKNSRARIDNEEGQNGLVWGNASSYSFYALYPSPRKSGASFLNADLLKAGVNVTAPIPAHQAQGDYYEVVAPTQASGLRGVYKPDMNYAYMYAAAGVASGADVELPFKPLMTAFEIQLGNDNTTPLVVKDIFLFTDSEGSALSGTFAGTISANNTFSVTSTSGTGKELHADLPEFENGGTLTINKGKPITFTLFALPIDIQHLGLRLKLADDSYMSITFRYSADLGGAWIPFQACRKYRITNVNASEDERFTYTIEVFDPETGAAIDVTDNPITLYGHDTVDKDFGVRSYRKSNLRPSVYEPVLWKIQYSTDDGASWTDLPDAGVAQPHDATFSITAHPRGTGVDNNTYTAGEARTAHIIGTNTSPTEEGDFNPELTRAHLRNADPRGVNPTTGAGSPATAFDLSRHAVYGNIDATTLQNTANSYVISAPGWYKFPLVYGNAISGGQYNKSAYWPAAATNTLVTHPSDPNYGSVSYMSDINAAYNQDGYVSHYYLPQFYNGLNNPITSPYILTDVGMSASNVEPVILWQDMDYLTDPAILPYAASSLSAPDNIGLTNDGGVDYMWFKIDAQDIRPGNIVLALRTKSGTKTILWSWHIWITDRDLNPTDVVRGITLMPTNLGFVEGSDGAVRKYQDRALLYRAVAYTVEEGVTIEQATCDFEVKQIGDVTEYMPSVGSNPYYQWGRKDPMIPSLPGGGSRYIIRNTEYPDLPSVGSSSIPLEILPTTQTANYASGINKPYKPLMNNNAAAIAHTQNPNITGAGDGTSGWVGGPVYPFYKGWRLTREDRGPFVASQRDLCIAAGFPGLSNWYKVDNFEAAPGVFLTVWYLNASAPYNFGPYSTAQMNTLLSIDQTAHFKPSDFENMPYTAAERSASALAYNLWNSFIYSDHVNTSDNKFKTIYDPCPPGFTVPVRKLAVGTTWPLNWEPQIQTPPTPVRRELPNPMSASPAASVVRSNTKGVYYDGAFFPYTGGRIIINTNLEPMEQGVGAYYWTDNPFNIQAYNNQPAPTDPMRFGDGGLHFYQFSLILSTSRNGSNLHSGHDTAWSFTKGSAAAIRPMVDPHYLP